MRQDFPFAGSPFGEVVPKPLSPRLADVKLRSNRTNRGNAIRRQLTGEYLRSLLAPAGPGYSSCRACHPPPPGNCG